MKKLGETIRKIRRLKGITQYEIYDGVVSRSFYSAFEHGKYEIKASAFLIFLERLEISLEEFKYIQNEYKSSQSIEIQKELFRHYYAGDIKFVKNFYETFRNSKNERVRLLSSQAYLYYYIAGSRKFKMTYEPLIPLKFHLTLMKNWTLVDVQLFVHTIFLFQDDVQDLINVFKQSYRVLNEYMDFDREKVVILREQINLNCLQTLLVNQDYKEAHDIFDLIGKDNLEKNDPIDALLYRKTSVLLFKLYFEDFGKAKCDLQKLLEFQVYLGMQVTDFKSLIRTHREHAEVHRKIN